METKKLTQEQVAQLKADFDASEISVNPRKTFLSTIKAYSIITRLNTVFGVGSWQLRTEYIATDKHEVTTKEGKTKMMYEVIAKATLDIPEYGIHYEQLGGNEDECYGDSAKGAVTDALNKCASYLWIGYSVYNGDVPTQQQPAQPQTKKYVDFKKIKSATTIQELTTIYNDEVKDLPDGKMKQTAMDILGKQKKAILEKEAA